MPIEPTAPMATRGRTLALLVILLATFIDLIGVTVLNVILPSIQTDLDASPAQLQWMQAGYTLVLAVGIVSGARLGDMLGHKRVFIAGMAGFAASSALCALSVGPEMLVGGRVVQGLFAALVIPQVLSQIQIMYASNERGGPMAAYSSLSGLAATLGPILGPLLLKSDLAGSGWRMAFWVNVPLGLFVVVASWKLLPESRATHAARIDVPGVILASVGLVLVLYPLIDSAGKTPWPAWTYGSILAGVAVLVGFVFYERRVGSRGGSPLVEMSLFRFRSVQGGLLLQLLFFVPAMGFFLVFMLFLQNGIGMSPMRAGLTMLPWSVAVPVFATLSAAVLLPRIGRMTAQIGLVVMAIGFTMVALAAGGATPDTDWTDMFWGVLVGGAGMGMLVAPLMQLTLTDVPIEFAGSGSALYNTVTQLAASIGVAVIGTVFFTELKGVGQTSAELADGYGSAMATSLWLGVGLLAVAFASSFLLPRGPVAAPAPDVEVVNA
ncbi:MFS transporter [Embleya sp. NPDC056575]|uniref:MFS transporter n=1 Tax=unclassified Embleya TaxID=2699296 RepID=UPI0036AA19FB